MPAPFNQQGKARLASVGREVIFGSGTYTSGSLRPAGLSRWKCTLASPSVSSARKLCSKGWVFLTSDRDLPRHPGPSFSLDESPRTLFASYVCVLFGDTLELWPALSLYFDRVYSYLPALAWLSLVSVNTRNLKGVFTYWESNDDETSWIDLLCVLGLQRATRPLYGLDAPVRTIPLPPELVSEAGFEDFDRRLQE